MSRHPVAVDATVVIGITGLITTGGSAVWLRWLDNRRHARQLMHDRQLSDQEEVRQLLDEAAGLTRRAMWTVAEVADALRKTRVTVPDVLARMQQLSQEAALMVGRLALRLGQHHEVTTTYDATVNVYHRTLLEGKRALEEGFEGLSGTREKAAARVERVPEAFEGEFVSARRTFIEAAQRLVGVDLSALA